MQITEALLLTDEASRQHIREYREFQKLKPQNGGSKELERHLLKYTYLYVKDIAA